MAKKINITAQLNAATTDGILAVAGQIFDAKKGKFQEQVNEEFENALEETITSEDTDMVVESIEEGIVHNALRKNKQILTEAEKYQARHNISAITAEEAEKIAQDKINETSVSSPDKLQAVKELSSWLENNPDSAATMNAAIQENAAGIATIGRNTGLNEYSQFSTGMDYAIGDVVLYDGVLFRFKTDHSAGEWDYNEVEEWSDKKEREEKVGTLESRTIVGNTKNLFNPAFKLEGLVSNNEKIIKDGKFFSFGGIHLKAGHTYVLFDKKLQIYGNAVALNYRLFQTSDRVPVSYPMNSELHVSDDAINPIVYITSYKENNELGVSPLCAEDYMFVDVTEGYPVEFKPFYLDSYLDKRLSDVEMQATKCVNISNVNLLNPTYFRSFIIDSQNLSYVSHNPMVLKAGHKYGLYRYNGNLGNLNLGTGLGLNIIVTSDNYDTQRYRDDNIFELPSDIENPIGYITNYKDENTRIDYTNYMFVDVTESEPTGFISYINNKWYANKIGDIFGYATFYSGYLSIDTIGFKVTTNGRFFVNSSYRRATNSMVNTIAENVVTDFESNDFNAIHFLIYDVQANAFYVIRQNEYNSLIMTKALVIVGFGPLSGSGSRFYSLCNELIIDGHKYEANPSIKLENLQTALEGLDKSLNNLDKEVIKKSLERTENLFNYEDDTYKNRVKSDDGIWSDSSVFSTAAIPLEAGKTYIKYNKAGKAGSWFNTNARIFNEDGTLILKTENSSIQVPENAVNPIGYFAYYNQNPYEDADYDKKLLMLLPEGVSSDEQIPYIGYSISDEALTSYIKSEIENVEISKHIVQAPGSATNKVMSQSAVTNYVENKVKEISSKTVEQTTGQSTERPMSQKSVTDALSELSEQIIGEPVYRFAERPDDGYENFLVDVNCSIADNTTVSNAVQDSRDIRQDRCILKLPVNYSRSGEPVRLVICGHGTGWKCTASTTIPWAGMDTQLLLDEGYAVLGCNGTPGELDGLDQGHNCVPECYRSILAAYKYVIEKYNIKRDGVLTSGLSMGTYMTGQIALFKDIPVLAQIFYGFSGEIWKAQYTFKPSVRQRMFEKFGFTGSAPSIGTANPPSTLEQEYIKSNIDKWSGYDLLIAGLTNKPILDTFNVWLKSSTLTSEEEAAIYNDAIVVGRPPCKFFVCDDDTVSPARWSEYMVKMIINGGGYAELRHYASGGHNSWGVGDYIQINTKYGGVKSVNGSSYEGLLFLQKFDK